MSATNAESSVDTRTETELSVTNGGVPMIPPIPVMRVVSGAATPAVEVLVKLAHNPVLSTLSVPLTSLQGACPL